MDITVPLERPGVHTSPVTQFGVRNWRASLSGLVSVNAETAQPLPARKLLVQIAVVFLAYLVAGKLGQATTNIRSSNLGPVWPAYGIALGAILAYGYRVWPGVVASAFVVAFSSSVPALAAAGQAVGATVAAVTGAAVLRRTLRFDCALSRLSDAVGLVVFGAFGSAVLSASIGVFSLYATHVQAYSGLAAAWLIYWLGDSTGVLLVTPLVFTLPTLFRVTLREKIIRFTALLTLLTATCFVIFGDLHLIPIRLHVLAFAVLPFVMWAAIDFGVGGASLSVFLVATMATLATAFGFGPFAANSSFINAILLDVLFAVLSISGLVLGAVIAERERAKNDREQLIREQAAVETRLRLAAIVESSDDAIFAKDLDGTILSWNGAAQRIFGFSESDVVGRSATILVPPELGDEENRLLRRFKAGESVDRHKTTRLTKAGRAVNVFLTITPLLDSAGTLVGVAEIVRDLSEQDRAEKALSRLSSRLIHAQEQERARIARELHDDIGQRLSMLSIELTALSAAPGLVRESQTNKLRDRAADIATDVQALAHALHSSKLELLGLPTASRGFCDEFAQQTRAEVVFVTHDVPGELSGDVSVCLFRVLQEALHNAAKHSGVRQFDVHLWGAGDEIHLVVRDAGQGFDVASAQAGRGLGLVSMGERLKLVGGVLSIESNPQRGTTIYARAPFAAESA
jgi:PAS domain S-box-containing protein